MATNENEIGIYATLDIKKFEENQKKLDAMLANLEKDTAQVEKESARIAKSQEKTFTSANAQIKNFGVVAGATLGALIATYKKLETAANFRSLIVSGANLAASYGQNFQTILDDLDKASQGTLSFEERVTIANQSLKEFGADFGAKFPGKLAEISAGVEGVGIIQLNAAFANLNTTTEQSMLALANISGVFTVVTQAVNDAAKAVSIGTLGLAYMFSLAEQGLQAIGQMVQGKKGDIDFGKARHDAEAAFATSAGISIASPEKAQALQSARLLAEQDKAEKKRLDDLKAYNEKIRDATIKAGEDIQSAEADLQEKQADAWQNYIEKVNNIIADGISKRANIARDYQDKLASAEQEYQRGQEDLTYGHGQKLADIERDYQRTIADIESQYREDALDAARNLDAIGLLRAKERRDKDLANAGQDRNRGIADESIAYQRSQFELQRNLDDKRQMAARDRDRALSDQRRDEQEQIRSAKEAYNKQVEAARNAFNDKIAAIQNAYQREDVNAQAHYLNQEAMLRNHYAIMASIAAQFGVVSAGTGVVTSPTRAGGSYRRAAGGVDIVNQATQFTVGEAGPELMITAPLSRAIPSPMPQIVNHTGNFQHSVDASINSAVAGLDGRITAAVARALREVVGR